MLKVLNKISSKQKFFKINFFYKIFIISLILVPSINYKSFSNQELFKLDKTYLDKKVEHPYILGSGDLINIEISRFLPKSNLNYRIDGSGNINIYELGRIYVSGLTISELEKILRDKYKDIIFDNEIKVSILSYRPIRVNVQGEVYSPGLIILKGQSSFSDFKNGSTFLDTNKSEDNSNQIYDPNILKINYRNFPTLYDAIRGAGGLTLNSDLENIQIIRKNSISNGGGSIKAKINFENFINNRQPNYNIRLFDGDIIILGKAVEKDKAMLLKAMRTNLNPKLIDVQVSGRVRNGGPYKLSRLSTLNDAIEFAGGKLPISGKITLGRINGDGSIITKKINYKKSGKRGSESNPYLMQGDIINVGSSSFNKTTSIINEITAPISGLVNVYYLYKVFE